GGLAGRAPRSARPRCEGVAQEPGRASGSGPLCQARAHVAPAPEGRSAGLPPVVPGPRGYPGPPRPPHLGAERVPEGASRCHRPLPALCPAAAKSASGGALCKAPGACG
ncbi:unnamed protein product, partial [Effrenium voratum]